MLLFRQATRLQLLCLQLPARPMQVQLQEQLQMPQCLAPHLALPPLVQLPLVQLLHRRQMRMQQPQYQMQKPQTHA